MVTHRGTALLWCSALAFVEAFVAGPSSRPQRLQQQQQQQQHSCPLTNPRKRRRRTHCLHCTAVAVAVTDSAVCEADDDEAPRYGGAVRTGGKGEGELQSSFVGEDVVVLSDWLEKSRQEGKVEVISSREGQGAGDRSPPHRFQELIQHMWAELSQGNQLGYLGRDGQGKVKGALTVLAAYCALREHPLQTGVDSPQQAFTEMDFNRDGEVSFDEFVRWYSMSTALDEPKQPPLPTDAGTTPTVAATADGEAVAPSSPESALARASGIATETLVPAVGSRGSRLLADVEKSLALSDHSRGSAPTAASQPRPAAVDFARAGAGSDNRNGVESTGLLSPRAASLAAMAAATAGAGFVAAATTEEEKEAARERWLAGGAAVEAGTETPIGKSNSMDGGGGGDSAAKDLDKALEMLCVLVKANADAETLVAALASCIVRNPMGRNNLEVIEEQFGSIIRGIVEDRLLLERLPEPTSSTSYLAIQQSFGVKPVLDLDDHHAKLMRDYLVHSSRDARAVVVHMADLTCRLRDPSKTPAHARHGLALEALQLYVPVSNAMGLGSSFHELEELGYKTIFPQTYSNMALWHRDVKVQSHDIVREVKKLMLEALHAREDISRRVSSYHLEGRTKGLVSTFRKVFRQNKRATDVHDILGFRIIVHPERAGSRANSTAAAAATTTVGRKQTHTGKGKEEEGVRGEDKGPEHVDTALEGSGQNRPVEPGSVSKPARSVFTVKTFPPPYRDADSRLLHDVYEVLVGLFDEVPGRFKNYVDFPKKNGYRSVHTTVMHPTGIKMEFQVRTASMHAEAEGGTASHSLYKGDLENPEEASAFRSKMASNIMSPAPAHRQLPSTTESSKRAAAASDTRSAAADSASQTVAGHRGGDVPLLDDAKIGEVGAADGERLTPASDSNRSPEP